jgi:SAM-dependent methyltransferase
MHIGVVQEKIKRAFFQTEDWCFERLSGLDLGGIISPELLSLAGGQSQGHASSYQAVWCRNVRTLIKEATKGGERFDYFVDIGSGKGKACLYARRTKAFPHILGVEFSAQLIEIAEENLIKTRADNVSFVHADATDFVLPAGRCLVFLFNPFDDVVLERFIENNLNHISRSRTLVAYANDQHRASLAKYGFVTRYRDEQRAISLHSLP